MSHDQALALIAKAWGKQRGWAFMPWIDGGAIDRAERIASFHEGKAYRWPRDRDLMVEHMATHEADDLYWCPSLFENPRRVMEMAMDECCLWADLDAVDPRGIKDYPPTIAWETSPGRFQALWLMAVGQDVQGASWRGGENHRLTYHLGADPSGWDTTQLLRVPGWVNHKPEHRSTPSFDPAIGGVPGRLVWSDRGRRRYMPDEWGDLPQIEDMGPLQEVVEGQIEAVDVKETWKRLRLRVSKEVRELVAAREASGDRSDRLWQMERDLADAGATVVEIVALVRGTVWNKFMGRQDEVKRLTVEASKAVAHRAPEQTKRLEMESEDKPKPQSLSIMVALAKPARWLVKDLWTVGGMGFVAGEPKTFKSWFALDLALSVATGADFLGKWSVVEPGPVLYVQEEDGLGTLKRRFGMVWPSKVMDRMVQDADGTITWLPASEMKEPDVAAVVRSGLTLSDPGWQSWLDEALAAGWRGKPYAMVVLDPLMMMVGDVDDNRNVAMMEKVFKPLGQLRDKHGTAVVVVHHMKKMAQGTNGGRGGQRMLGSMANHAWTECALYLTHDRTGLSVEVETKDGAGGRMLVRGVRGKKGWDPRCSDLDDVEERGAPIPAQAAQGQTGRKATPNQSSGGAKITEAIKSAGRPLTAEEIAKRTGLSKQGSWAQIRRARDAGAIRSLNAGGRTLRWDLPEAS